MVNLAGTLTGRLTPYNVAIGSITPNVVRASVGRGLDVRRLATFIRAIPLNEVNDTRRITGAVCFLTDPRTSCVAKRIVNIGNNCMVWRRVRGVPCR